MVESGSVYKFTETNTTCKFMRENFFYDVKYQMSPSPVSDNLKTMYFALPTATND